MSSRPTARATAAPTLASPAIAGPPSHEAGARSGASASEGADARFNEAAARLIRDLQAYRPPSPDDLATVLAWLERFLRSSLRAEIDPADVAQEAVVRVLERVRTGGREIENPAAYLTTIARYASVDALRQSRRRPAEVPIEDHAGSIASSDDAIAALLDREATSAQITAAMRLAVRQRDAPTIRVVRAWLDMAHEQGKAPTSREVAARVGLSHTSVNQILKRFRELLSSVQS
jgi:RNA polymerase sigma factor (sigma-70 family)